MSDVLVSSYQTGGVQHDVPTDQFSLNFGRIDVEYRPMMPDGSMGMPVKGGFDVKAKG
jgi:type VI secretion system secreted protein Hcp